MGRLRKYNTEEEGKEAQRQFARNYYWKNKERLDKEAKERYQNKIKSNNELREDL
jgi:hypothetical protein